MANSKDATMGEGQVSAVMESPVENFHTVDSWGVTKAARNSVIFYWEIHNFFQTSNNGTTPVRSPFFFEKSQLDSIPLERTWQLRLVPENGSSNSDRRYMSIHLYLLKQTLEQSPIQEDATAAPQIPQIQTDCIIRAAFEISILDVNGKASKQAGGFLPELCAFHLRSGWGYDFFFSIETLLAQQKTLLPNGRLLLKTQLWIYGDSNQHNFHQGYGGEWYRQQRLPQKSSLAKDFGAMFHNGILTDVTIQVGSSDVKFQAHKMILSACSSVFAAMFTTTHQTQEGLQNLVKIPDFDGPVIYAMLNYIYTNTVLPSFLAERCVDLFQIADKYNLPELREMCQEAIIANLTVENCMKILVVSDMHHCVYLKEKCLAYIKKFEKNVMQTQTFWDTVKSYPSVCADLYLSLS